jgi:hypothetical protein
MATGKATSSRTRKTPRNRRRSPTCPRSGRGSKMERSSASRAMISSDIKPNSAMVPVLRGRARRPAAIPSRSKRAFRSWGATALHEPKLPRRTMPKRPGGRTVICLPHHHPLSPKPRIQASDVSGCGFFPVVAQAKEPTPTPTVAQAKAPAVSQAKDPPKSDAGGTFCDRDRECRRDEVCRHDLSRREGFCAHR